VDAHIVELLECMKGMSTAIDVRLVMIQLYIHGVFPGP